VAAFLADKTSLTLSEVATAVLGPFVGARNAGDQRRLGAVMRRLGWEKRKANSVIKWVKTEQPQSARAAA
jgi:hypothetical protein